MHYSINDYTTFISTDHSTQLERVSSLQLKQLDHKEPRMLFFIKPINILHYISYYAEAASFISKFLNFLSSFRKIISMKNIFKELRERSQISALLIPIQELRHNYLSWLKF